jgi:hypothetical protein
MTPAECGTALGTGPWSIRIGTSMRRWLDEDGVPYTTLWGPEAVHLRVPQWTVDHLATPYQTVYRSRRPRRSAEPRRADGLVFRWRR